MVKNTAYILVFIACRLSFAQSAPYVLTPNLQQAYNDVFKLKINTARQLLAKEKSKNPANAMALYVENYIDMVTLLVSDSKPLFEQLAPNQDKRLEQLADLPTDSPYQRLWQAEIRLHWAFVKLKFGKEVSASWDIIKAYRLLDENARTYPEFIPTYKSLGLLHVLIGSTPQNYQWVAKLLGLKGNIQLGMREIQQVVQKEPLFDNEAKLINILLQSYILGYTEKQNEDLLQLVKSRPDNLLLHFFGATISMKDGRGEQALQWLDQRPTGTLYAPFPFLDYLKGEILLQKSDYEEARIHLNAFLTHYKGQNFLKDAYLKMFLSHWLAKEDRAAKPYLNKVLTVGTAYVEADKAAQKFAENFTKGTVTASQKVLMKARLAFDGGYLTEAMNGLIPFREASFVNPSDKAEYQYRLGRIFQRQNQPDSSIAHYERAIVLSQTQSLYYGATSALQLGYIYQNKGQKAKAIAYFKQALNYPKHEYKNSIDNKARAALTLLGVE